MITNVCPECFGFLLENPMPDDVQYDAAEGVCSVCGLKYENCSDYNGDNEDWENYEEDFDGEECICCGDDAVNCGCTCTLGQVNNSATSEHDFVMWLDGVFQTHAVGQFDEFISPYNAALIRAKLNTLRETGRNKQ